MSDIFNRVRVRRRTTPFWGIFGAEYWWEVHIGLTPVAMLKNWADAQAVARMVYVGLHGLPKTRGDA